MTLRFSDSSKSNFKQKNNKFQFYEDKKYIKIFTGMNFKLFNIFKNEKHILT